jgi:protocatechuate 3,4-dioxygenase beta subunit
MKNYAFTFAFVGLTALFFCLLTNVTFGQEKYTKTPADYEGPFYPVIRQQDEDNDLLQVAGRPVAAKGDILNLSGVVLNTRGEPQNDVMVEIWQTDPTGKYKDPRDSTPGPRDPNFQYWGKTKTAKDGSFSFKTLVPGGYAPRPAHIHFKVWVAGQLRLTSQIYFKNYPGGADSAKLLQSPKFDLLTIELQSAGEHEFNGFFQIVI